MGGGGSWWACWQDTLWLALAAVSSPPAHSELSESHVRSCRATSDRVGQNAVGRPRGGWQQAVISESHPSSLSGNTGRRLQGGSLHRACAAAGQSRQARAPQKGWDFCE